MPPASGGTGEQQQQQPMDCASLEADKDHDAMFNDPVSLRAIISEYRTLKARVPQLEADLDVARVDATEPAWRELQQQPQPIVRRRVRSRARGSRSQTARSSP